MVKKITKPDEDGAVDFVCNTTDDMSTWAAGAAAACPGGYGAGSTMMVIDETVTPHVVKGFGWYDGSAWARLGAAS